MKPPTLAKSRGKLISRRRERLGISQEDLARLCGCSVRTIGRIEDGANASITTVLIAALHAHLGIPMGELGAAARRGRGA